DLHPGTVRAAVTARPSRTRRVPNRGRGARPRIAPAAIEIVGAQPGERNGNGEGYEDRELWSHGPCRPALRSGRRQMQERDWASSATPGTGRGRETNVVA